LSSGTPPAVTFWYREAAAPWDTFHPSGLVTTRDPPIRPGTAFVRLDTRGRLLELAAPVETITPGSAPEWSGLLAAAGLDPAALTPSAPTVVPPAFADHRAAWTGAGGVLVEAASAGARPVAFKVIHGEAAAAPWGRAVGAVALQRGALIAFVPVFVAALVLGVRNARHGRGDPAAARRVAGLAFGCSLASGLLRSGHTADGATEWAVVEHAAARALLLAAEAWILYMALEPYVRRRWPETLISWTRLLHGRFRDPLVGRDVLAGVTLSVGSFALAILGHELPRWRGAPAPRLLELDLGLLLGTHHIVAKLAQAVVLAVLFALVALMMLVLLRALLRGPRAAAAAFWLFWTALLSVSWGGGRPAPDELAAYAVVAGLTTLSVVRFGMLAMVAMALLPMECPVTLRWDAWFAPVAFWAFALAGALVAFGAWAGLAGRRIGWAALED
jgi:serine/threonine-protein kinase